jgi:DNA replication protein DnaC
MSNLDFEELETLFNFPESCESCDAPVQGAYFCDNCIDKSRKDAEYAEMKKIYESVGLPKKIVRELRSGIGFIKISRGNKKAFDAINKYRYTPDHCNIVLMGDNNQGKSLLLGMAARKLTGQMVSSVFLTEEELAVRFRSDSFTFEKKLFQEIAPAAVILLDDIGRADYQSKYYSSFLYNFWNNLWNACKPIIATTNYPEKAKAPHATLSQRMDKRCYARLMRGNTQFIKVER